MLYAYLSNLEKGKNVQNRISNLICNAYFDYLYDEKLNFENLYCFREV